MRCLSARGRGRRSVCAQGRAGARGQAESGHASSARRRRRQARTRQPADAATHPLQLPGPAEVPSATRAHSAAASSASASRPSAIAPRSPRPRRAAMHAMYAANPQQQVREGTAGAVMGTSAGRRPPSDDGRQRRVRACPSCGLDAVAGSVRKATSAAHRCTRSSPAAVRARASAKPLRQPRCRAPSRAESRRRALRALASRRRAA